MPANYQVAGHQKVTVRKIMVMRNHWYKAALPSVAAHSLTVLGAKKPAKELSKLKSTYAGESSNMPDPHPATNAGLDDYVPTNGYATYFDPKLPLSFASEIKTACDADAPGLALPESEIRREMAIAFIRAANKDPTSWTTIRALMHDENNDEYFLSTLTPINQEFHITYDARQGVKERRYGTTGLTSMNERIPADRRTPEEAWRPANFWYSELHESDANSARAKKLFSAFRSGAFAAYNEPDKKKRIAANLKRALGVVEAMVLQRLGELKDATHFFQGTGALSLFPIRIINIDLLSDTSIKGDHAMVKDHHAALRAIDERGETFTFKWPDGHGGYVEKKVSAQITMLDFNLAVNQASTFVLGVDQAATNSRSMVRLKNELKKWRLRNSSKIEALRYQLAGVEKKINTLEIEGIPRHLLWQKNLLERKIQRIQHTEAQVKALWKSVKATAMGEYLTSARLANLAYLLGFTVHFNCKSGKDRTGLVDIEAKFLARELASQRELGGDRVTHLPALDFDKDPDERYRHQLMLWESGSLQILERNTRGQSLKVADLRKFKVTYDAALAERLGGEQMTVDLRGLAEYTNLVDKMFKESKAS